MRVASRHSASSIPAAARNSSPQFPSRRSGRRRAKAALSSTRARACRRRSSNTIRPLSSARSAAMWTPGASCARLNGRSRPRPPGSCNIGDTTSSVACGRSSASGGSGNRDLAHRGRAPVGTRQARPAWRFDPLRSLPSVGQSQ